LLFGPPVSVLGVGHPVDALSSVRRGEAVCAQYDRPAGVTNCFQVCEYSIEPTLSNRCRNLFAKDCDRAALCGEPLERDPKLSSFILEPFAFAGVGEGLAGEGGSPNRSACWPTGEPEGGVPAADAGEEVCLRVVM
jgi:hypothetical protein